MRFTAAAVFFLASTPMVEAFTPNKPFTSKNVRRHPSQSSQSQALASTKRRSDHDIVGANSSSIHQTNNAASHLRMEASTEADRVAAIETRSQAAAYLKQYNGQSGAAVVYSKLVENHVKVVNGFSGGAVLPLLDQFHEKHPRHNGKLPIRWITNSNEASSGHIAEGIAKSMPVDPESLPVGVAIATSGPGVTNLITPLQDAICDGVPIVVLCGQAATTAPQDAFQSSPAVDLTRPCTKWSYQIKSAAEIPMVLDYAFYIARHGRPGPVFVDLPKDLQNQIVNQELIDQFIENNLSLNGPNSESNLARLTRKYRKDGTAFQAVHLGNHAKGLSFEITKNQNTGEGLPGLIVKPVNQLDPMDMYHADHHPTDHVYMTEPPVKGVKKSIKEGVLQVGGSLTQQMLNMFQNAKRPIIVAGQGCNDCPDELKKFAEKLQIPVTTTLHALGVFDERSELALNMLGMHGHPTPNFMIQEADLVICIGSRFDDRITGRMSDFVPEARKAAIEGRGGVIHVDIRLTENAKQVEPTYFVHSTGKKFLQTMNTALEQKEELRLPTGPWLERMKKLQAEYPVKVPHFPTKQVTVIDADGNEQTVSRTALSAQSVVSELDRQLLKAGRMDDCIFTTGVGVHQMIAAQLITWTQPRQMLSSGSLGTMGVSLGYAIGAKLANAGKMVISVDGDGSFNMTFTELKTLVEHGVPIKIMIIDNDGQMMVEYWQRLFHDNRLLAVRNNANPDYVKLAGAFGIKGIYCDHEEDLEEKMNEFLFAEPEEPVLFHVRVKRTPCLPLVAPGQPLQDMILEDVDVEVDQSAAPS
jgi:acetolactate synthase-1/2/3 large subunit